MKRVRVFLLIAVLALIVAACTSSPAEPEVVRETVEVPVTVEVERVETVTEEVEVTRVVEREVEVTRIVTEEVMVTAEPPAEETTVDVNLFEVTAEGLAFVNAPEQIPAGWTTFRFENEAEMAHFAMVQRLPEGIGIADQQAEVAPVFQEGMDLLNEGEVDAALAAFGELPEWYGEVTILGGPGLTAAGESSQATVYLEPGTYLLECYVKTDGVFHSYNPEDDAFGMVHEFVVTEEVSDAPEPTADLDVTISSEAGIEVDGQLTAGQQTVAVTFADQIVHEHFLGHDVHLVRLDDEVDIDALATWMDWTQPTGLHTPAPATFLGGLHEMPAGETGYFTVELEPGDYALIAEVPDPAGKGMLQTFTVP